MVRLRRGRVRGCDGLCFSCSIAVMRGSTATMNRRGGSSSLLLGVLVLNHCAQQALMVLSLWRRDISANDVLADKHLQKEQKHGDH